MSALDTVNVLSYLSINTDNLELLKKYTSILEKKDKSVINK